MDKSEHIKLLDEVLTEFANIPDIIDNVDYAKKVIARISNLLCDSYKVKLRKIDIIKYEPYGATIPIEAFKQVFALISDQICSIKDSSSSKKDLEIKKLLK